MDWRRLAVFIAINIVVSVAATLITLSIWESSRQPASAPLATPIAEAQSTPAPQATPIATSLPTDVPAPTFTPTPPGPFLYTIQPGDTLGSLALEFDVALEELLAANGLTEDAILSVGQQITIPVPGVPEDASSPAATPEATSAPALVVIREIEASGSLEGEAVIFTNLGDMINLTGWTLSNGSGKRYTFPTVTLFAGAELKLHTRTGANTPSNLYWEQSEAVWGKPGTIAYLRDASGVLVAQYRVP